MDQIDKAPTYTAKQAIATTYDEVVKWLDTFRQRKTETEV